MNKNSSVMLLIGLIDNIGDALFDGMQRFGNC